mgnify:CR=1 FL=1
MQLGPNNISVVDRHQRPNVLNRVLLRTFFINDGQLQDPYQFSSVSVFALPQGTSPSGFLDSNNLIDNTKTLEAKMVFQPSDGGVVLNDEGAISEQYSLSSYTGTLGRFPDETASPEATDLSGQPCSGVSGVYRIGTGEYAVVLDGLIGSGLSGVNNVTTTDPGIYGNIKNTASAAATYIDIWTVKITNNSFWKTYINYFELYAGGFFTTTQPLLLTTKNDLTTKRVVMGSIIDLKVTTDITVGNRAIDSSIKNIMNNAAIYNPSFKIVKVDQQTPTYPSRVTVLGFDAQQDIDITSENTLIFRLDTTNLLTTIAPSELTTPVGTYAVQVRYTLLKETIISPMMYFTVS